jgi:ABC-type bacteriocin/lantibiotic exporter with double-glycine peptidase domain
MDEYNQGMDPEIKRFFKKIINSFSIGLLWLLSMFTAGLFFDLGITHNGIKWYNIVFYIIALLSFIALLFYFYRIWKKGNTML